MKIRPLPSMLPFALLMALSPLHARDATSALREAVEQRIRGDRSGACLAVAKIGDDAATAHVCADPKNANRIGPDYAFEIGSISKTMTAFLLAQQIEAGRASIDDPLAKHLPEGTVVPEFEGQPILLRHLVTHGAGLPSLPPGFAPRNLANPYSDLSAKTLLSALGEVQLSAAPGSQMAYSNFGTLLLSLVVSDLAATEFEQLIDANLFTPLGMDGAYVDGIPQGVRPATGHLPGGQPTAPWTFGKNQAGVGGVRATLSDMQRYVQAQVGAIEGDFSSAIELTQQPLADYGGQVIAMHWFVMELDGRRVLAHEGGTGGFSSLVAFEPESGNGVVILSDTALTSLGGLGDLGQHLMDASQPLQPPRMVAQAPDELIDALVGRYTLQGGMQMEVRRNGDALEVQAHGQPAFEMGYDSAGDFFPLAFDALLTPQKKADGRYAFSWSQGGGRMAARRIDTDDAPFPAPDAAQLQAYAGTYPLTPQFALTVFAEGEALYVQGSGQPKIAVKAIAKDVFEAAEVGAEIHFRRDDSGEVASLELHQGGQVLPGERQQ